MAAKKTADILARVAEYYTLKLAKHGQNPRGVDWNGQESQVLRFEQLCKIINSPDPFSLNDLGCGYGALYDYLLSQYKTFNYRGYDISPEMINAAQGRYGGKENTAFTVAEEPQEEAEYGIASGIFNVRLSHDDSKWRDHLHTMLDVLNRTSRKGFAFNCLTSYSDKDKLQDYLYYANPCELFDFCKHRYSRHVALLHDYGLYEFTILVKKQL